MMLKLLLTIILLTVLITGCSDDCDDYNVPGGYYEWSRYSQGDYESVTYYNGYNHWITYTSTDNGCQWDKAEYWN